MVDILDRILQLEDAKQRGDTGMIEDALEDRDPLVREIAGHMLQEVLFGQIVVRKKFGTPDQVTECLKIQRELRLVNVSKKLGDIMVERKYLTGKQRDGILEEQAKETGTA